MTRIDLDARKAKKEAARANQYPRPVEDELAELETIVEPVKAKKKAKKKVVKKKVAKKKVVKKKAKKRARKSKG